jgi:PIN domain
MPTAIEIFFLDTNVLLHCASLDQLPWKDLTGHYPVRLVVALNVVQEIDKLKTGAGRQGDRARKASRLFDQIRNTPERRVIVRAAGPETSIEIAPTPFPKSTDFPDFDWSRADDRHIAEVKRFGSNLPPGTVSLLTNDTIPLILAEAHAVHSTQVPEDWLLPAESDPKDKQISALTAQISELKKSHASVEIQFPDNGKRSLTFGVPKYRALAPNLIDHLMEYVTTLHPKLTASPGFYGTQLAHWGASNGRIHSYDTAEYPQWLVAARAHFENLPHNLHSVWTTADQLVKLSCTGGIPANSVTVRLRAKGNVVLRVPGEESRKESQDRLRFPRPPQLKLLADFPRNILDPRSLSLIRQHLKRDKNQLYADSDMAQSTDLWQFSCEEFMHHNSHEIPFALAPKDHSGDEAKGAIECEIQGTNIREPVVELIPVIFEFVETETLPVAEDLLKGQIFGRD